MQHTKRYRFRIARARENGDRPDLEELRRREAELLRAYCRVRKQREELEAAPGLSLNSGRK